MNTEDQNLLFEKYLSDRATEEETRQLLQSFGQADESELKQLISVKMRSLDIRLETGKDEGEILDQIYSKISTDIRRKTVPLWQKAAVAASLLLVGGYFYFASLKTKYVDRPVSIALNEASPGKEDAVLTLADGRKIQINNVAGGVVATDAGSTIRKTGDGSISYEASASVQDNKAQNIIETPKGRQFRVQLPDGTAAWLNAGSSLTYPVSFAGAKQRLVSMTGEIYFEVAHNASQPFWVKAGGQTVQVLGTHFNVNSYADEGKTVTTLEEGAVRVVSGKSAVSIVPGQQAVSSAGQPVDVRSADLKTALAWKDGKFKFKDAAMPEIMRQVARWYDIKVEFSGPVPSDRFTGTISQKSDLSQVLLIFKITQVNFELVQDSKGRTLVIRP